MTGRAALRVPIVLRAEVLIEGQREWQEAEVADVGPSGAGFVAEPLWAVGTRLRLRCDLPTHHGTVPVDATATIRWRGETSGDEGVLARARFRYGIVFDELESTVEDRIVGAILFIQARRWR